MRVQTKLRFLSDFDFRPAGRNGQVRVAFMAGMVARVTRECAAAAVAAGAAEAVEDNGPGSDFREPVGAEQPVGSA